MAHRSEYSANDGMHARVMLMQAKIDRNAWARVERPRYRQRKQFRVERICNLVLVVFTTWAISEIGAKLLASLY